MRVGRRLQSWKWVSMKQKTGRNWERKKSEVSGCLISPDQMAGQICFMCLIVPADFAYN